MEHILQLIQELQDNPLAFSRFGELKALRDEYIRLLDKEQETGLREIGG